MLKSIWNILLVPLLLVHACIGIDLLDDPIVGENITVVQPQVGLKVEEMHSIEAVYFDPYGIDRNVQLTFESINPLVATVDARGVITAQGLGTTFISVGYRSFAGPQVQVNVVASDTSVAVVLVRSSRTSLNVGSKIQFDISIFNKVGEAFSNKPIQWFSENSTIATVDQHGIVTGVALGKTDIHAKVEGIKSNTVTVNVEAGSRSGTFVPAGGYKASGTAILENIEGKIYLELSSDFETSFALGTFIYLANTTNGGQVRTSGIEISEIKTNGMHRFDLTARFPSLKISDYRYVIVYCKPAGVTFGFADMSN